MNEIGIVIERQSDNEGGNDEPKRIPFWRVIHALESNETAQPPLAGASVNCNVRIEVI
jgi:hypothetical protein